MKCLEQNIRKQIDCKKLSNTKQMNWVQNIEIEMRKYKAVGCFEIKPGKVSTWSFCFYLVNLKLHQASSMQLVSKITLDGFDFKKYLTIR